MKALKIIGNIFAILLAIILSLFTFASLVSTPVISTGTALLQPDTLQKVLTDMDLSKQLESTLKQSAPAELSELDVDFVNDLIGSDLMGDILELYIGNLMGVLEDDRMESINQSQIHTLLEKHMPSLVAMVRKSLPEEVPVSDTEITDYTIATIEPALISMVSELPDLEDLGVDETALTIIHKLYDDTLVKLALGLIAVLSILVVLLRFPRFKGFLWLGITYLLASVILVLVSKQSDTFVDTLLPSEATDTLGFALEPILNQVKYHLNTGARNIAICAVVFILIFILGRILLSLGKKKEKNIEIAA